MAQRRMFTLTVVDSDSFLDLPLSAQALYFHLSMRGDDDGFVNNPKKIQRSIGCNDNDFQCLIDNDFIIPFNSGIIVIKHWKMHNYIQKDRYKGTVYSTEKSLLTVNENNIYNLMDTECIQDVSKTDTQVRIGKDSKDKSNIYVQNSAEFEIFWNAYPKKKDKKSAEKAFKKIAPDEELLKTMLNAIEEQKKSAEWQKENGQYIPHPATWLNGRRWEDILEIETNQHKPSFDVERAKKQAKEHRKDFGTMKNKRKRHIEE